MSLPISPKIPRRFTPSHYLDANGQPNEGAPVYIIKAATRREKLAFDHEVSASGAGAVTTSELYERLREGIAAVVLEEDRPRLIELVDQAEVLQRENKPVDDDLARDLAEIQRTIRPHYPPFAQAEAAQQYRLNLMVLIAAQMFLIGWENVSVPFERRAGKVPDEVMELLPERDCTAIGWQALALIFPSEDQSKNSESPAQSPSTPGPSQAEKSPPMEAPAGISSEPSTLETHA